MVKTQGNKKFNQYLNDLIKNKNFIKLLKKAKTEKNHDKGHKLLIELSEKYGLDQDLFFILWDEANLNGSRKL